MQGSYLTPNQCYWLNSPSIFAQVATGAASIIVALSTITVLGSFLLLLAQQGIINVAGLNAIAQMVPPAWLCISLGAGTTAFLLNIICCLPVALHCKAGSFATDDSQKLYNTSELGVLLKKRHEWFSKELILRENEYYLADLESGNQSLYGLAIWQKGAHHAYFYFKNPLFRERFISQWLKNHTDRSAIEKELFGKKGEELGIRQRKYLDVRLKQPFEYWPCKLNICKKEFYAIIFKNPQNEYCFYYWDSKDDYEKGIGEQGFFSPQAKFINKKASEAELPNYDPAYAESVIGEENVAFLKKQLKFAPYAFHRVFVQGKKQFHALAIGGIDHLQYFKEEKEARGAAEQAGARSIYSAPGRLDPDYVTLTISKKHQLDLLSFAAILDQHQLPEYGTFDIPHEDGVSQVFALVYNQTGEQEENSKILYFDQEKKRDDFIRKKLACHNNFGAFLHAYRGVPQGMYGLVGFLNRFNLNELLVFPGDTFKLKLKIDGKVTYWWVTRQSDLSLKENYSFEKNERKEALAAIALIDTASFQDKTSFISTLEIRKILKDFERLHLQKIVPDKECWEEIVDVKGQKLAFLFFRLNGEFNIRVCKPEEVSTFLERYQLKAGAKERFNADQEYPKSLGRYLARQSESLDPKKLKKDARILLDQEYRIYLSHSPDDYYYPDPIFVLVEKNQGKIRTHYFKNEEARAKYIKQSGYKNGYERHMYAEAQMEGAGRALLEKMVKKQPLYHVIMHQEQAKAHVLICSVEGDVSSNYYPFEALDEIYPALESYKKFDLGEWEQLPLAKSEKKFLKQLFAETLEFWSAQGNLKPGQFVIRERADRYIMILVREDKNKPYPLFFKKNIEQEKFIAARERLGSLKNRS
jgi:hypothetical protein